MGPQYPFVEMIWDDAWQTLDEMSVSEVDKVPAEIRTYGYLVWQGEKGAVVASDWTGGDKFRLWTFAPKDMIRSIKEKKLSTPRKKNVQRTRNVNRADGGVASPGVVPTVAEPRMPRSEMPKEGESK